MSRSSNPSAPAQAAGRALMQMFWRRLQLATRERIYIVPTWHGLVFLVGLVWVFFEGALQSNQLAYFLGFFLVTLFLVGMFQTNENLKGVAVGAVECAPGPSGGIVEVSFRLENRSREPRFALTVQFQPAESGSRRYRGSLPVLRPGTSERIPFTFPAMQRGVFPVPRVRIFTVFPLGLFYAWRWEKVPGDYFVYPKPEGSARRRGGSSHEREAQKAFHLPGDDFAGHRAFQRGDPQRHIDWKALARGLGLLVKRFDEAEAGCHLLRWDDLPGLPTEVRLAQLSSWVHDCHQASETYALMLPGVAIGPGTGLTHFHACLKELARLPEPEESAHAA